MSNSPLKDQYDNLKDWLKYAETKNGVLLSFSSLAVFNLVKMLSEADEKDFYFHLVLWGACIPFGIGVVAGLLSLFPETSAAKFLGRISQNRSLPGQYDPRSRTSLIYFGDLLKLKPQEYLLQLTKAGVLSEKDRHTQIEEDFAEQIVILAQIVQRKFSVFNKGVSVMIFFSIGGIAVVCIAFKVLPFIFSLFQI